MEDKPRFARRAAYAFEDLVPLARVAGTTHVVAAWPNAPDRDPAGLPHDAFAE